MHHSANKARWPGHTNGLTWREVLVALGICAVLGLIIHGKFSEWLVLNQMTSTLSNMKQLHLATEVMALDGTTIGDTNLGWPGSAGGTFTNWARKVVPDYLTTNDFCKLLSAPGKSVPMSRVPESLRECAILVYAVSTNSPENTVFLSTANFTNGPQGGGALEKLALPFGNHGFVVFRKAGDGNLLRARQVADVEKIGSYAPMLK